MQEGVFPATGQVEVLGFNVAPLGTPDEAQVAETIQSVLQPKGVAILIDAQHQCMTTRGVRKPDVSMVTTRFTGVFQTDTNLQRRFLEQARLG